MRKRLRIHKKSKFAPDFTICGKRINDFFRGQLNYRDVWDTVNCKECLKYIYEKEMP